VGEGGVKKEEAGSEKPHTGNRSATPGNDGIQKEKQSETIVRKKWGKNLCL